MFLDKVFFPSLPFILCNHFSLTLFLTLAGGRTSDDGGDESGYPNDDDDGWGNHDGSDMDNDDKKGRGACKGDSINDEDDDVEASFETPKAHRHGKKQPRKSSPGERCKSTSCLYCLKSCVVE